MNQKELIETLEKAHNNASSVSTDRYLTPERSAFYAGKAQAFLLAIESLRNLDDTFSEGVLYALDYLSDLYEGVEMTSIAIEYGYKKENA